MADESHVLIAGGCDGEKVCSADQTWNKRINGRWREERRKVKFVESTCTLPLGCNFTLAWQSRVITRTHEPNDYEDGNNTAKRRPKPRPIGSGGGPWGRKQAAFLFPVTLRSSIVNYVFALDLNLSLAAGLRLRSACMRTCHLARRNNAECESHARPWPTATNRSVACGDDALSSTYMRPRLYFQRPIQKFAIYYVFFRQKTNDWTNVSTFFIYIASALRFFSIYLFVLLYLQRLFFQNLFDVFGLISFTFS